MTDPEMPARWQEQALLRLQAQLEAQRSALLMFCRQLHTYGFCDLGLLVDDLDELTRQQPALSPDHTELARMRSEVQRLKAQIEAVKRERPYPAHPKGRPE